MIADDLALQAFGAAPAHVDALRRRAGGGQANGAGLPGTRNGRRLGLSRRPSGGCRLRCQRQHDFEAWHVMTPELPPWLDLVKAFAAPFATIVAAGVAAYFVRQQWKTAEKQAETAIDQLRWNLFAKRYAIYESAREAINLAFEKSDEDHMPNDLDALFLRFEEARFFFHDDIYLFLKELRNDIKRFLSLNYAHRQNRIRDDATQNVDLRKKLLDEESNILNLQQELYSTRMKMPARFGDVLNFPQLTGRTVTK
ncbi:MAG: hypothetical protein ACLPNY_18245 [Roseiarcus sp.]